MYQDTDGMIKNSIRQGEIKNLYKILVADHISCVILVSTNIEP